MSNEKEMTPQERFDYTYISTSEIAKLVGVTRATVLNARNAGKLPGSIKLEGLNFCLWERQKIKPMRISYRLLTDCYNHQT